MIDIPQVLSIAGIDSSGGAGINADVRTFDLLHTYSATVITGLTAQNTLGVQSILPTPIDMIEAQMTSVLADLSIKAIKTGALFNAEIVKTVGELGSRLSDEIPVIIDPVMIAKGGAQLLSDDAITALVSDLLPHAFLLTPNLLEAEVLTGKLATDKASMYDVATKLQALGVKNVLLKGGHGQGKIVQDLLLTEDGKSYWYDAERIITARTHGTGDTLSAYLTAGLAHGYKLADLMPGARRFMNQVIAREIAVGAGHGPLNHWAGGNSFDINR